jgi:hypothetical protein
MSKYGYPGGFVFALNVETLEKTLSDMEKIV